MTLYIAPETATVNITVLSSGLVGACTTYGANPSPSVPQAYTTMGWSSRSTFSLTRNFPEPLTVRYTGSEKPDFDALM